MLRPSLRQAWRHMTNSIQLTHMDFAGGRITMSRMPLSAGQPARLRLAARDISLTLEQQQDTSILNILPVDS